MKKLLALILASSMAISLVSCGKNPESQSTVSENSASVEPSVENSAPSEEMHSLDELDGLDVEQELFDVKFTIPADFVEEGTTQESLDAEAKEAGFQSVTLNEDGTVTYVMTKSQHQKLMEDMKTSLDQSLKEMVESETYPSFQEITANDDYTEFTVKLSSSEIGMAEAMSVIVFFMYGGIYHAFNGTQPDDIVVKFVDTDGNLIDESHASEVGQE